MVPFGSNYERGRVYLELILSEIVSLSVSYAGNNYDVGEAGTPREISR